MEPTRASELSPLTRASDVVHQRSRLAILAALYELGQADFASVRRITGLTEGNLSRHLQILDAAGALQIDKGYVGRRPRTWARITEAGTHAFEDEVAVLRQLVANADATDTSARETDPRQAPGATEPTNAGGRPAWS
jgi:DNA-binding MarR family transcriptional regulator